MGERNQRLMCEVKGGRLVVSIGVSTLAFAASESPAFADVKDRDANPPRFKVTDEDVFAREVRMALEREEEDGTTALDLLLDKAFQDALDDGCEGVEEERP